MRCPLTAAVSRFPKTARQAGLALGIVLLPLLAAADAGSAQIADLDPEMLPKTLELQSGTRSTDWDEILSLALAAERSDVSLRAVRYRVDERQASRALFTITFAQQIDAACPFLSDSLRSLMATTTAKHPRQIAQTSGMPSAQAFLRSRPCGHETTKAVQASLLRLLTPVAAAPSVPIQVANEESVRLGETSWLAIPGPDQHVEGAVIGWSSDLKASLQAAKSDGKPILLLLGDRSGHCPWCDVLLRHLLEHDALNRLAGQFHAVMLEVGDDPRSPGRVMFNALGAKGLPMTSVFTISEAGSLNEQIRLNGVFSNAEYLEKLRRAFPTASIAASDRSNWKALDAALARKPSHCMPIETLALCSKRAGQTP